MKERRSISFKTVYRSRQYSIVQNEDKDKVKDNQKKRSDEKKKKKVKDKKDT
jgi:hypothetical protein